MHRNRVAAVGRASNLELPIASRDDPDVATTKESCAANTDPLVIQRVPGAIAVAGSEDRETIRERELRDHSNCDLWLSRGQPKPEDRFPSRRNRSRSGTGGSVEKPVAGRSRASRCGAMQMKRPALIFPDINHSPADHAITKNTDALVIERLPFAESVGFLQHSQFLVEPDMPVSHGVH
jgi:hypothetical protein